MASNRLELPGVTTDLSSFQHDGSQLLPTAREIAAVCAEGAAEIDRDGAYPAKEMATIAATGLLSAPLRPSSGGLGWGSEPGSMTTLLRVLTILGSGNLSVARLYEGHVNALLLIQQFGSPDQIARMTVDTIDMRHLFAVWNTEAADGVHLTPLPDGRFTLQGAKSFASGAGFVVRPLLTAKLPDGGWQLVLPGDEVMAASIDQTGWLPIGMKASASGRIDFSGIPATEDTLIGSPGDYYRQPWFSAGALRFAAAQLGGAIALVDAARADLQTNQRTDDDAQRARMASIAISIESCLLLLDHAATLSDCSQFGGATDPSISNLEMTTYANLCRTAIERCCLDAIEYAHRSVGARALLKPHPIERISRDLTMYLRQPAPDAALRAVGAFALNQSISLLDAWGRA